MDPAIGPPTCLTCGRGNVTDAPDQIEDFWVLDLERDVNWGDPAYVCKYCAHKIGLEAGMIDGDLLEAKEQENRVLLQRIHELDSLLAAEGAVRGIRGITHCECGAPLAPGVHFCSHCGRPAIGTPPVLTCTHCGQPLPAAVNFCAFCGHGVAADEYLAVESGPPPVEDTMTRSEPEAEDWLDPGDDRGAREG